MAFAHRLLRTSTIPGLLVLVLSPALCTAKPEAELCLEQALQQKLSSINLQTDCPDLYARLKTDKLLDSIQPSINDEITSVQLIALNTTLQNKEVNWQLDQQGLDVLLNHIRVQDVKDPTGQWWTQFKNWLKSFEPGQYEVEFRWLLDLINALIPSEHALKLFTQITIYFLILISVVFIIWELYQAGAFNHFGLIRKIKPAESPGSAVQSHYRPGLTEIKQMQPAAQVSALLNWVINKLTEENQLPDNASLTNAELVAYLRRHRASKTAEFSILAAHSEPVLYGKTPVDETLLQQCWQLTRIMCSDKRSMQ